MIKTSINKKGEFDPLAIIGKAVLVLLILVILLVIVTRFFRVPIGLGQCSEYGKCVEKSIGCNANEVKLLMTLNSGCTSSQVCCMPKEQQTEQQQQLQDLTPKEQEAVENAIILTLNNDPTPIADRSIIQLKEGVPYTFNIKINDKLNTPAILNQIHNFTFAVYIKDSREAGKVYYFLPYTQSQDPATITGTGISPLPDPVVGVPPYLIELVRGDRITLPDRKFIFTPSMLDTYKGLELYVIIFRKPALVTDPQSGETSLEPIRSMDYFSNTNNWFAVRNYRLNVESAVKISGMSGTWVPKDEITITCTDVTCTGFGFKLVKLNGQTETAYQQMIADCKTEPHVSELAYITGTSIQQTGIPLNINIGGFRLPLGQQRVIYQTMIKPTIVTGNKASILIDKATMISTFYGRQSNPDLFVGDSTYLCVEATRQGDTPIYSVSKIPLKVDVLPPYIDQEAGMRVIYPDRLNLTLTGTFGGTYHYREYPKVLISGCYDFGQSGCSNYDYYIHPGEFIQLNSLTGDVGTGITALILTEGLNMLMNALAAQDPLNTICPYIFSTDYRPNTNPEIRFPYRGQGIMCIRASDKVGNKELYWKALWLPDQMFSSIVPDAAIT
ncbi:hypothetical protein JXB28_00840 [Candidatus Woesearchaeota archaeon]|nr:hypothetical protein [Candidatus Woesearchaeota archaeon]